MKSLPITLGFLGLLMLGLPIGARAGLTVVDARAATYDGQPPTQLGDSNRPLATSTLYSNTSTFSGAGYAGGGATAGVNGSTTTTMVADDISTSAGGAAVTSITFSAVNFNSTAVSASVELYFYTGNPATGPGTLLGTLTFAPLTLGAGSAQLFGYTSATTLFTIPTSGQFYVGETFSDFGGTTGATTTQLNGLGLALFNPPTVGSSMDSFFQSSSATSDGTNNPAGGLFTFGGNPVANFGFAFSGTAAVPEPSSLILTGLGGGLMALAGLRRAGSPGRAKGRATA